jgi:tetraacyldisaccharide 4'-kinase
VISIGNLAVGGRAKTPLAALVAERLVAMGERPAILSRGYGRRDVRDGVVVVRDPLGMRGDLDRAGDEPLMLARRLPGVAVLVSSSRYLAGRLAEHHFGATVHVLDDGFQHFDLYRDADVVVVGRDDLADPRTLPSGRLREPLDAAAAADALVALGDDVSLDRLHPGTRPVWRIRRRLGAVEWLPEDPPPGVRVLALAGIAGPDAFFRALRDNGWTIARELRFSDHHAYDRDDMRAIVAAARASGADAVLTTEKDLVRLLPHRPFALPVGVVRLFLEMDGEDTFGAWLGDRVQAARAARRSCASRDR